MEPREYMNFLRDQAHEWSRQDTPAHAFTEAEVVAVYLTTAKVQRPGFDADNTYYPCIAPYSPKIGDKVLCAMTERGLYIMGRANRGGNGDVTTDLYAPLDAPRLSGEATADTPDPLDYSNKIATTAHVKDALISAPSITDPRVTNASVAGTWNAEAGAVVTLSSATSVSVPSPASGAHAVNRTYLEGNYTNSSTIGSTYAPLASPTLTGTPSAPTPTGGDNSTKVATTAFIQSALGGYSTTSHNHTGTYAPLASPALTGTPTAPTAGGGTNTTQIATTAFVTSALGGYSTTSHNHSGVYLPIGGGTLSGSLTGTTFYPGSQSSRYIDANSTQLFQQLSSTNGSDEWVVKSSTPAIVFGIASNGAVKVKADATSGIATGYTTLGSLTGRWAIYNDSGSLVGYIPVYTSIT